jgi:hypothetical protein
MKKKRNAWRILAKALGSKEGKNDREADKVAFIRLLMFLSIFITNGFIIANTVRHWNDIPSNIPETKKERILYTNSNILKD